jgi:ADP-heptose:LPS heptosyltransferase
VRSPKALLREGFLRLSSIGAPTGQDPLPDFGALGRVLLVYVNWRLGNNLLATPAAAAFTEAFPRTRFEFLGGPFAAPVLQGYPLARVHVVRRRDILDPVRLFLLVRRLRRECYDAVVHTHSSTATIGAFLTGKSKAPIRVGCRRPAGNVYFTCTVPQPSAVHKVDRMNEYLSSLGVPSRHERALRLSPDETADAEALLAAAVRPGAPRVAVFLAGRHRKRKAWELAFFADCLHGMRDRGLVPVVILGPEEVRREHAIRSALGEAAWFSRLPLRTVGGIVSRCDAALVPDSGPMHLAVAVGTPTVALFRAVDFGEWGPRPPLGRVVHDPEGRDTSSALSALDALLASAAARR